MRLQEFPADVILLDLKMPRMGGMDVLRRLRQAGNDVPVIIVTAHGSIPDAVAAMKLGAVDFLPKPITPAALRQVVNDVVQRRPRPQPARAPAGGCQVLLSLIRAKRAINLREFGDAERLLRRAIDLDGACAEAHTLLGVLHETLGEPHSAYHSYKAALEADHGCTPALVQMRRYCERFCLDFENPDINPAAVRSKPQSAEISQRPNPTGFESRVRKASKYKKHDADII
jgi:two-component SAPR family response regulator